MESLNLKWFRDQMISVIGAQVLRGSANLNSEGGMEPYLQVEDKIQLSALKNEQNNLFMCPLLSLLNLFCCYG